MKREVTDEIKRQIKISFREIIPTDVSTEVKREEHGKEQGKSFRKER